jgi:hypothetical protein
MNTAVTVASLALSTAIAAPGLALPAAVAIAAPATAPTVDPIFAAIEAHRDAFIRCMERARIFSRLKPGTRKYEAADARSVEAYGLRKVAEEELANTEPTTMAGILALLGYVNDFHCQVFVHPEDPSNWHSGQDGDLGELIDEDIIDRFSGKPVELPFMFWVMRNVQEALQTLTVKSPSCSAG